MTQIFPPVGYNYFNRDKEIVAKLVCPPILISKTRKREFDEPKRACWVDNALKVRHWERSFRYSAGNGSERSNLLAERAINHVSKRVFPIFFFFFFFKRIRSPEDT